MLLVHITAVILAIVLIVLNPLCSSEMAAFVTLM